MILNFLKAFLIFLGLITLTIVLVIGGFFLKFRHDRNLDIAAGKYSISKARTELTKNVERVVITSSFCDYNPESSNPNCIASEAALDKASESLLKFSALVNMHCPEHISQHIVGNLNGILLLFGNNYYQRNMYSMQMYQPAIYESIVGGIEDILNFDFKTECPDSIEMEEQIVDR